MILITGATGTVGRELSAYLGAQGVRHRVMTRDPGRAKPLLGPNTEVVTGDFTKPETLDQALRGVDKVFLLSSSGPDQVVREVNLVEAAQRAGVKHLVKLSVLGADTHDFSFARNHREIEEALKRSGIPHTLIRPNLFMQNLLGMGPLIAESGVISQPLGKARIGMVDVRDIAEVAAHSLVDPRHVGRVYAVTGPERIGMKDAAKALSKATGRKIKYVDVPPDQARQGMVAAGWPEWNADAMIELTEQFKKGYGGMVTEAVKYVTGRPARSIDDFARDYGQAFRRAA